MARRILMLLALLVAVAFAGASSALGHAGGLPWIWVENEQAIPGQPALVVVVDFEAHGMVTLELVADDTHAMVGDIPTEADGHGEAYLPVPTDFPRGYAELVGRDQSGGEAVTLVYVGEDVASAGPPPPGTQPGPRPPTPVDAAAAWWADPSVLVLLVIVVGALLAALVAAFRRIPGARRGHPPGA